MNNPKSKIQNDYKVRFQSRLITFSLDVIKYSRQLRSDRTYWPIADQLVRCSASVGANVFEAKGSSSLKDYIRFFQIALRSANEAIYWLILIQHDSSNLKTQSEVLLKESTELAKIIATGIVTMKKRL